MFFAVNVVNVRYVLSIKNGRPKSKDKKVIEKRIKREKSEMTLFLFQDKI